MSDRQRQPVDFGLLEEYISDDGQPHDEGNHDGTVSTRKHPLYDYERTRSKKTYNLTPETTGGVRRIAIAERLGAGQVSRVAEALLRFAVGEFDAGNIKLKVTLETSGQKEEMIVEAVKK